MRKRFGFAQENPPRVWKLAGVLILVCTAAKAAEIATAS
jgi:hypothetical protein